MSSQQFFSHVWTEPPFPGYYKYFHEVKCLAQGHNMAEVGFEPPTSRSGVRCPTTEQLHSPKFFIPQRDDLGELDAMSI